jgi:hypothetical protein
VDFVPPNHVDFVGSAFMLFGILGLGWGVLSFGMLWQARRLSRLQKQDDAIADNRGESLSAGPSRVVHGRVEVDGDAVAIEIDVVQSVTDYTTKNGRSHDWTETSRRVTVRPFRLTRDDGRMVLVEPDDGVLVVDDLAKSYPSDRPRERVRSAVVRAGERVHVYGDVLETPGGGAYRGGPMFTMHRPRRGRLLVATDAIRGRYRDRIRSLCGFGVASALLFCFLHAMSTVPFVATMVGARETATIIDMHDWRTRTKGGFIRHYSLTAAASDGFELTSEVPEATYAWAQNARLAGNDATVPIRRAGHWPRASCLGDEPNVSMVAIVPATVVAVMLGVFALFHYSRQSPWYDRRTLVETGGSGHWVETRTSAGLGEPIDPNRD